MNRHSLKLKTALAACTLAIAGFACKSEKPKEKLSTPETPNYGVWMADSEMARFPEAWETDFNPKPKWGYVPGLICKGILDVWKYTGDDQYFNYVKDGYVDVLIDSTGTIQGYKKDIYNIDKINSGKILFDIYEKTGDERYKIAIETLRDQLREHPRVSEGGFWHKQIYTHQMWLDGLYMGTPFYAEYITKFGDSTNFDDITNQFLLIKKYLKDDNTGLYYHGWDESKSIFWADPETGRSKHFWGRGLGWYYMALLDVLDFLPKDHKDRDALITIFQDLTDAIIKVQQDDSGVWYQILDLPNREGNYLESTCATMYVYGMVKGMEMGFLPEAYSKPAMKGFNGILKNFIKADNQNHIHLTDGCSGAGLGPADNLKRDGSFEYYMSEPIRDNDGKGVGPFMMVSLMIDKNEQLKNMIDPSLVTSNYVPAE